MATNKKKATSGVKKGAGSNSVTKKAGTALKKVATSGKSTTKVSVKKPVAKPISKTTLAKKAARPVEKKAVSKKLATNKESVKKKTSSKAKTSSVSTKRSHEETQKQPVVKKVSKKAKEKEVEKTNSVNIIEHKKLLKKALKNVSKKKEESVEPEKPFVMPKTNTEKARKYEPNFVKSILDQVAEEESGPTLRYSDVELNEFKELITRKLETAKKELGYLQGLITRKDEMGGDDTDNRYMTMEDGSLSMEREQLSQMASRQITFIDHLEKALMRIENKTYGICRVTGKLIDKARLRAVPHATLSIEAKMGIAK
jgi:RNA polymerase-binding transcription factor DksA